MRWAWAFLVLSGLSSGCDGAVTAGDGGMDAALTDAGGDALGGDAADAADAVVAPPTQVMMDFTRPAEFYNSPFPSEDRRTAAGGVDLSGFPNFRHVDLVDKLLAIVQQDADGFGISSASFFQLTGPVDPARLPDPHASLRDDSPVFLVSVDAAAPDYLQRYPVLADFRADGGPFGARNLLSLLPVQGIPLRPDTLYAAVVLRELNDDRGRPLDVSPGMADLVAGRKPDGMPDAAYASYGTALAALQSTGLDPARLAGLAVFRTGTPDATLRAVRDYVLAQPLPTPTAPFARTSDPAYDQYCVYATTVRMPVYQRGQSPYTSDGGDWVFDADGHPVEQTREEANFFVTVPRAAMPAAGYPVVVFVRTGGGGDRPLIDRGVQTAPGEPPLVPGSGPAMGFAYAGWAGAEVDGPLGGLRNYTHGDEQFLIFNIGNPVAMRDNLRQSALELMMLAHMLRDVRVDVSDCPGASAPAGGAFFDTGNVVLMGHSMGATIAPLALAYEPTYRAGLLSGAGGSWINNVMYKLHPLEVRPLAEALLALSGSGYHLHEHDPVLTLLQWAGEPADPPVYARHILREPFGGTARHVLMMQGIVDNYIPPPVANATSLSVGLDLAGPERDDTDPALAQFTPLGTLLDLSGARAIALPAQGNAAGPGGEMVTAVVTQNLGDGVEDGHEAVFQTEGPKHQYTCFLQSLATGVPRVPSAGGQFDPCN